MAQSRSKLIENVVRGSFHQGDTSWFSENSVGHQCVPNCVIAALYASIYHVSKWTTDNLDRILYCGDKLYNAIPKTNDFLQVQSIGTQITEFGNTYNFQIEDEFFGRVRKDINIGTTLEKATFTVIQQNRGKKVNFMYSLCWK